MDIIDPYQILKLIFALFFVIALMGGLSVLLKKLGLAENTGTSGKIKRLKIIESLPLDTRRRAVIIQCDNTQHLVILGPNSESVVKTDIAIAERSDENS